MGLKIYGYDGYSPNFFVMDTDYVTYSMVYACEREPSLWIMSRTRELDQDILDRLNE